MPKDHAPSAKLPAAPHARCQPHHACSGGMELSGYKTRELIFIRAFWSSSSEPFTDFN